MGCRRADWAGGLGGLIGKVSALTAGRGKGRCAKGNGQWAMGNGQRATGNRARGEGQGVRSKGQGARGKGGKKGKGV
jgi:hypothetical protein